MSMLDHHAKVGWFVVIRCNSGDDAYLQDGLAFVLVPQTTLVSSEYGLGEQTATRQWSLGLLGSNGSFRLGGLGLCRCVSHFNDVWNADTGGIRFIAAIHSCQSTWLRFKARFQQKNVNNSQYAKHSSTSQTSLMGLCANQKPISLHPGRADPFSGRHLYPSMGTITAYGIAQ